MKGQELINKIQSTLLEGGYVVIATYTKIWEYNKPGHVGLFKAVGNSAYVRHGKRWDCIDYCGIRFARPVKVVETELMHEHRDF